LETELNKEVTASKSNVIGSCCACKVGQVIETIGDSVRSRHCAQCGINNSHGDVVFTMAEARMWK